MTDWSREMPTADGVYLFCGWVCGLRGPGVPPEWHVLVLAGSFRVLGSRFLSDYEPIEGVFRPMDDVPEEVEALRVQGPRHAWK